MIYEELEKSMANSGHGHVFPRPDGALARCGGPSVCAECSRDQSEKTALSRHPPAAPNPLSVVLARGRITDVETALSLHEPDAIHFHVTVSGWCRKEDEKALLASFERKHIVKVVLSTP